MSRPSRVIDRRNPDGTVAYQSRVRERVWNLGWEFGALRNVSEKSAVGATFLVGINSDYAIVGAKARYRRWLTPEGVALDFGLGIRSHKETRSVAFIEPDYGYSYTAQENAIAYTGDVALNVLDHVAMVARVDVARFDRRYRPTLAIGLRGGSRVGAIGTAAFGTTVLALVITFAALWDGY